MNPVAASTIFVTDLDGTLLDDCGRLDPEAARMLNALADRGVRLTCATARTPATVEPLLHGVKISIPAIVMTGAALWDHRAQRYLDMRLMPSYHEHRIAKICRSHGVNPFIYSIEGDGFLNVWHNGALNPAERRFVDERRHLRHKKFLLDRPEGLEPVERTILMFAEGPRDAVFAAADAVRASGIDCSVSAYMDIYTPSTGILEVFAPGISKADAVLNLKKITGADRVVVFGDNLNDIPMMQVADQSYAVANALPEAKAAATAVIGPNTAHAVPRTIASLCGFGDLLV